MVKKCSMRRMPTNVVKRRQRQHCDRYHKTPWRIFTLSHVVANVLHIITFNLASLSLIVCSLALGFTADSLLYNPKPHHSIASHESASTSILHLFSSSANSTLLVSANSKQYQTSNFTDWEHDRFLCKNLISRLPITNNNVVQLLTAQT